jgi:hypothetical protein
VNQNEKLAFFNGKNNPETEHGTHNTQRIKATQEQKVTVL